MRVSETDLISGLAVIGRKAAKAREREELLAAAKLHSKIRDFFRKIIV